MLLSAGGFSLQTKILRLIQRCETAILLKLFCEIFCCKSLRDKRHEIESAKSRSIVNHCRKIQYTLPTGSEGA